MWLTLIVIVVIHVTITYSRCWANWTLFLTSLEKPEKRVEEEEAAPSSSSAEQQHQSSEPEEKQEAAAVEPPKDTKKDSRRCVYYQLWPMLSTLNMDYL